MENSLLRSENEELSHKIKKKLETQIIIPSTDTDNVKEQIREKEKEIEVLQIQILNLQDNRAKNDKRYDDLSKEKQLIIEELTTKLTTSEVIIKEFSEKLLNKNDNISKLKYDLEQIKEENTNMIGTIRIYEEEIKRYQKEVEDIKLHYDSQLASYITDTETKRNKEDHYNNSKNTSNNQTNNLEIRCNQSNKSNKNYNSNDSNNIITKINDNSNCNNNNNTNKNNNNQNQKHRILLLTDEYGKYLFAHLDNLLSLNYHVQVICKPKSTFKDVINGPKRWISEFTRDDFVVVLAGLNNDDIDLDDMTLISNMCFYTNLIVCTIPAKYEASFPYKNIESVNNKIVNIVSNLRRYSSNINFLDLYNSFRYSDYSSGIFLNKRGLRKMASLIKNLVVNFKNLNFSSLKHIEFNYHLEDNFNNCKNSQYVTENLSILDLDQCDVGTEEAQNF